MTKEEKLLHKNLNELADEIEGLMEPPWMLHAVKIARLIDWQPQKDMLRLSSQIDYSKTDEEILSLRAARLRGPNPYKEIPNWFSGYDKAVKLIPEVRWDWNLCSRSAKNLGVEKIRRFRAP